VNAYTPHSLTVLGLVHAILAVELLLGYGLARLPGKRIGRVLAWTMALAAEVAVERLMAAEPAGLRMIFLITALLFGMKAVVAVESGVRLSPLRWLGFCVLWFGMRPGLFTKAGGPPQPGAGRLFVQGLLRLLLGLALIAIAWGTWRLTQSRWLATPPLLVGLSFALHFGAFNITAALWRRLGVDCRPLFRAPILATSLNEFWSKRWNLAFSEMTALAIYRPVSASVGRRAALIASFVVSGAVHELGISLPVRAGFGLPSLYFCLHGLLILVENALERRGTPINRLRWVGRVWTLTAVVAPLLLVFHPPFLKGVVWPLIGIE
jgi:alginate O-acetyltransferase complex protein AlgI